MAQSVNANALFDMHANFSLRPRSSSKRRGMFWLPFGAAGMHTLLIRCLSIFLVNKIHLIDLALFSCFASVNNNTRTIHHKYQNKFQKPPKKTAIIFFLFTFVVLLWNQSSAHTHTHCRLTLTKCWKSEIRMPNSVPIDELYSVPDEWTSKHWTRMNFKCLPFWLCAYKFACFSPWHVVRGALVFLFIYDYHRRMWSHSTSWIPMMFDIWTYCSTRHTKYTHTHTISTPIVNANNRTKGKRKTATMREPISSGIKKYVYVAYVFCLIRTKPVCVCDSFTVNLYRGFSINRIKWHHLLFENRIPKTESRKTQTHTAHK